MSMILDGTITFSDATVQNTTANTYAFGLGQTWQNVSGSRSAGTTYTNTTSKPICVALGANGNAYNFQLTVGGIQVLNQYNAGSGTCQLTAIVPAGTTYVLTITTGSILTWAEFR